MNGQGMAMPAHMKEVKSHLENDITYPASKADIIAACDGMSDVSKNEKKWLEDNLPDKTYANAEEAKKAINML
ncbi:MAG: hypothetical protein HYT83_03220 [Candidatus Levybacteria bacterium]|nr:hypothetical protein [Candidatus Levybacteria bacterium]